MAVATREIRVLHSLDSLAPGGLENGVVNVARRLHGRGFDVHAGCLRFRGDFAERMPDPSKVVVLGKGAGFSPMAVVRLWRLIRSVGADVIHSHNLGTLIYASLATLGGRTVPIVHGEHGQLQPQDLGAKRMSQRRRFFRHCQTVHVVSSSVKDNLASLGLDEGGRILVTPNGVDCDRFCPPESKAGAKESLNFGAEDLVVGIVGRLVALKRHELLFGALERLGDRFRQLKILVVGDGGADREHLIQVMKDHPMASRIIWTGHQDDLQPWYQAMDLLAAPSEIEGLSNAVLEGMATGLPVMAHVACGNAEVIDDGRSGYLRDIATSEGLAEDMARVFDDRALMTACGAKARESVQRDYSMEAMEASYRKLYWNAYRTQAEDQF